MSGQGTEETPLVISQHDRDLVAEVAKFLAERSFMAEDEQLAKALDETAVNWMMVRAAADKVPHA
mgnify:CR=1 FL=1